MERHNAMKLFERSKGIGCRCTNYVMDVVIVTKKLTHWRYTLERIHNNAVNVTNVHSIEKLLHGR